MTTHCKKLDVVNRRSRTASRLKRDPCSCCFFHAELACCLNKIPAQLSNDQSFTIVLPSALAPDVVHCCFLFLLICTALLWFRLSCGDGKGNSCQWMVQTPRPVFGVIELPTVGSGGLCAHDGTSLSQQCVGRRSAVLPSEQPMSFMLLA